MTDQNFQDRSGVRPVRGAIAQQSQWWFARLDEDLLPGQSAVATLYISDNPPQDDPDYDEDNPKITVYSFFTGYHSEKISKNVDVVIHYHQQYKRYYVLGARCY